MGRLKIQDMKMQVTNYRRIREKMFIRSTAMYVFRIAEPFVTIKIKCVFVEEAINLSV